MGLHHYFPPPVLPFLSPQKKSGRSLTSCSHHSFSHGYVTPQSITTPAFTTAEIPRKTVSRLRYNPDYSKNTEKTPRAAGIRGVWQPLTCGNAQSGPHHHKFSGKMNTPERPATPQPNERTQTHFALYYINSKGWNKTIAALKAPGTKPHGFDKDGTAQALMFLEGSSLLQLKYPRPAMPAEHISSGVATSTPSSCADTSGALIPPP